MPQRPEPYNRFKAIDFPEYEHREYPKYIEVNSGTVGQPRAMTVNDADEEKAAYAKFGKYGEKPEPQDNKLTKTDDGSGQGGEGQGPEGDDNSQAQGRATVNPSKKLKLG